MKRYFKIIEDIHLYAGLFISPIIVLFAVSAVILNHDFVDWQEDWQEWTFSVDETIDDSVTFKVPNPDLIKIEYAKDILEQLNIKGEIANVFRDSVRMYIPVTKPGYRISIKANLLSGIAYIHSEQTSFWMKLNWLHKMPGPHNASIRGNWMRTNFWNTVVDLSVICLLVSSLTGIILWYFYTNERGPGLIALIIGILSFVSLVVGLII